jgi:hypothetical protein
MSKTFSIVSTFYVLIHNECNQNSHTNSVNPQDFQKIPFGMLEPAKTQDLLTAKTQDLLAAVSNDAVLDLHQKHPDLPTLCRALQTNTSWKSLILSGNNLDDNNIKTLYNAIENNTTLTDIDLRINRIKRADILVNFIKRDIGVFHEYNPLGDDGVRAFLLKDVHFDSIAGMNVTAACIGQLTQDNRLAEHCYFSANDNPNMGDDGVSMIANTARHNDDRPYVLLLANCGCTMRSMLNVAHCLRTCNLTMLVLSDNAIGDVGVSLLCDALSTNRSLHTLHVAATGITDDGIYALSMALERNTRLTELDIGENQISRAACILFAQRLAKNDSLAKIGSVRIFGIKPLHDHCTRVMNRKISWIQVCLLVASMRANQGHSLDNFIQWLIPVILGYEYPAKMPNSHCRFTRTQLEAYLHTRHFASEMPNKNLATDDSMEDTTEGSIVNTAKGSITDHTTESMNSNKPNDESRTHRGQKRKTC